MNEGYSKPRAGSWEIFTGDALAWLQTLPADSVHTWVTSPPYFGLRDYGVEGQIGLETTPQAFVDRLVAVFEEAKRVLHPTGTLWLNMGDSYNGYMANQRGTSLSGNNQHARPKFPSGYGK